MKHTVAFIISLVCANTVAGDWQPNWKQISLPCIEAETNFTPHHTKMPNGEQLFWVYLTHSQPKNPKYLSSRSFIAEVQEWVVNCEKLTGSIATIRYSNHANPGFYKDFAITHPGGREQLTSQQIDTICEFGT